MQSLFISIQCNEELECHDVIEHLISCSVCPDKFPTRKELYDHSQIVHKHTCLKCGKSFQSNQELRVHIKEHTSINAETQSNCGLCDKVFPNKSKLKEHTSKDVDLINHDNLLGETFRVHSLRADSFLSNLL